MPVHESIANLINKLDWNLLLSLIQAMIVFFIVVWIKNYITNLHAWFSFRGSLNIGYGTWVRLPTSVGHVDGQITSANRNVIRIDTKELTIFIPTKKFNERDWVLLKKEALDEEKNI